MEENMPQIISNTYKIIGEIGSGGGGVVYLAEHMRLNKKVVLKADKRTLSTKLETFRREVDALKDLSHTYIPQVYDFLIEDGVVYTAMDYIDGESFDKPLKRKERFSQTYVIEWACQLLEALAYLHSRPPHGILHADIKPANVMLTPQKEVRLIDFNIALLLGGEGAVAVGHSFGYASPEHYGIDHSFHNGTQNKVSNMTTELLGDTLPLDKTEILAAQSLSESTTSKKTIMLDVRSDIYSLGATLYHIMTGERPAKNATEVNPISKKEYSPAVIHIIEKAMNPNPDLRYHSAKEMLYAFEHLWDNDPRIKRHKRRVMVTTSVLTLLFFIGGFITFLGLRQREELKNAYVLAEYSGNALRAGDVDLALEYALLALPEKRDIFTPQNTAEAKKALTDALKVYDLSDGFKIHRTFELPSAPFYMKISPSGKTIACVYAYEVAVFDTDTAKIIAVFPAEHSALVEVEYAGEDIIVYAGDGGLKSYDIRKNVEIWTGKPATSIAISEDSKTVAAIYKDEGFAVVYDMVSGDIIHEINFEGKHQRITVNDTFANPNDNLLTLNENGTLLGVSFADGSLWVYDLRDREGDLELFDDTSGYTHFEGGFYKHYFAFSATNSKDSIFAVIDTKELEQTGGFESKSPFSVQTDENGIYVQTENLLVNIHPVTGEQDALVTTFENIVCFDRSSTHTLITTEKELLFFDKNANLTERHEKEYSSDFVQIAEGIAVIGSRSSPIIQIRKLESHSETEVFAYDSSYYHDEARISADGKTVMLFSYDQFRLYNMDGSMITEVFIPDAEQLYDQQYRRDESGSYLEVIYNDGTICAYSAKDGSVLYKTLGEKPDLTLYEEFFTDTLRIESPLHGTPMAYDRKTGKLVRALEREDYLTYVTQVNEYVITEYVTAEGERYGLLLNNQCETLAYLPYLCDIVEDELVFDYQSGNLRKSRIFHINELIERARELCCFR